MRSRRETLQAEEAASTKTPREEKAPCLREQEEGHVTVVQRIKGGVKR